MKDSEYGCKTTIKQTVIFKQNCTQVLKKKFQYNVQYRLINSVKY